MRRADELFEIAKHETPNFIVRIVALHESDPDLSWDDDGSILADIECGNLDLFCACATVTHKPSGVQGVDYLGNCVCSGPRDFLRNGCARDMVRVAVNECRANLRATQTVKLRK